MPITEPSQIYQVYAANPLTPTLDDIVPFQPDDAGVTEMGANTWRSIKYLFIPYKVYSALVSLSSGPSFTVVELQNDFVGTTFDFSLNSAGVVWATASQNVFTADKTCSPGGTLNNGGDPYFLTGYMLTSNIYNFDIIRYNGTQTGTPFFTQAYFEIRVYN